MLNYVTHLLWIGLGFLVVASIYLIIVGYRVYQLFLDSIVGRLIKTLVVVLVIELYSLGVVCFAFLKFFPKGAIVLLPIVGLWIMSLIYAIFAIDLAKKQVAGSLTSDSSKN